MQNSKNLIIIVIAVFFFGYIVFFKTQQNNLAEVLPATTSGVDSIDTFTPPIEQKSETPITKGNFEKKSKCVDLGEKYYLNYVEQQKHNDMFSFDVYDMVHEIAYSSNLDTCLLYVNIKFKDVGGSIGHNSSKFIFDLLNNKYLYMMAYGADDIGKEVVLYHDLGGSKGPSDFATNQEFMNKKLELFK